MNTQKTSRKIKALGLCSGGLDSILSALLLQKQGIDVTWICFVTPFFSSDSAQKAADQTQIPLIKMDITDDYMKMMDQPKAGFGKNMNPCMDCHALMFTKAGELLKKEGFDFIFSGEVLGQRPKSQNKNSLRYVEKNSGFDGQILRPLCAKNLPETLVEAKGLVDRAQLMNITGRSRKVQMQMAKEYGVKEYPSPAGGCLLTDPKFSTRLKDLMYIQKTWDKSQLHLLKHGRHFRLDTNTKIIVGRSKQDNQALVNHMDKTQHILLHHKTMAGPDVILTGDASRDNLHKAAMLCAAYTKSKPGEKAKVKFTQNQTEHIIEVETQKAAEFKDLMI